MRKKRRIKEIANENRKEGWKERMRKERTMKE